MLLTKHEGETFENQTVYISGQAFVRCNFVACTLILQQSAYHLEQCSFDRCNWHVNYLLLWGSPESLRDVKALVEMIEKAQRQYLPAEQLAEAGVTPGAKEKSVAVSGGGTIGGAGAVGGATTAGNTAKPAGATGPRLATNATPAPVSRPASAPPSGPSSAPPAAGPKNSPN